MQWILVTSSLCSLSFSSFTNSSKFSIHLPITLPAPHYISGLILIHPNLLHVRPLSSSLLSQHVQVHHSLPSVQPSIQVCLAFADSTFNSHSIFLYSLVYSLRSSQCLTVYYNPVLPHSTNKSPC